MWGDVEKVLQLLEAGAENIRLKGFRVVTVAEGKKRLENLERVTRRAGGGGMFLFLNLDSDLLISGQPF